MPSLLTLRITDCKPEPYNTKLNDSSDSKIGFHFIRSIFYHFVSIISTLSLEAAHHMCQPSTLTKETPKRIKELYEQGQKKEISQIIWYAQKNLVPLQPQLTRAMEIR